MLPTQQGSIRLFRLAGINLYLHWSWFLVAIYQISRDHQYSSVTWKVLEYLALFLIVLMHEFGHALACRQVGGSADQIVLWPLGGVAYVSPPQRPGATLWSIAAGPLVNVILAPVFVVMLSIARSLNWPDTAPEFYMFVQTVSYINFALLIFNLLPVYPLDGGQILRSLLWFVVGRARSLMIATSIGLVGVAALIAVAILVTQSIWLVVLCVFIVMNCWRGFTHARVLLRAEKAARHEGFACPSCHAVPPQGAFWLCGKCLKQFDTFAHRGACPHCRTQFNVTHCLECGEANLMDEWITATPVPPSLPRQLP